MVGPVLLAAASALAVQDTVVARAGPPAWGEPQLAEEIRVGALEGPPQTTFGRVGGVALGDDGSVYVLDAQVPVIRRFSADGRYLGDLGREGGGPGEYRQPMDLGVMPDGRIAVWDPGSLRVTFFAADGAYESSFPAGTRALFSGHDTFVAGSGGVWILGAAGPPPSTARQETSRSRQWVGFTTAGEFVDTVPVPPEGRRAYVLATAEGYRSPFQTGEVSALTPDALLVTGTTEPYVIRRPLPDGRVLEIRKDHRPVRLRGAEREQWEAYTEQFALMGESRGAPFQRPDLPREKPAFREIRTDQDGRLWVSVYAEAYEAELSPEYIAAREGRVLYRWREPPVWDVFAPDGSFLGTVRLPNGTGFMAARGDRVAGVVRGEFDEAYVVVYRIVAGS